MSSQLSTAQKDALETRHRVERDGRVRDRIKAVLLKSEGWTNKAIGQALRIHPETVAQHLHDWTEEEKLKPENGGSEGKLNGQQTRALEQHLQDKTYLKVSDICGYVAQTWQVVYTVSGMTKWLQAHGFRFKQPKATPAKADIRQQEAFIETYLKLLEDTPAHDPILFIDAVHPTMATKISCGWIKKGVDKPIATTASRTRVNIIGAIELNTMTVTSEIVETVNASTISGFFAKLKAGYPQAEKLHIILDQSGYHRSQAVKEAALSHHIQLHYLPPYSPNLNPIERLWKVMNEQVRNNVVFESAKAFREQLALFFSETIPKIKHSLSTRINDNFQTLKPVSSS
jgi:transposase